MLRKTATITALLIAMLSLNVAAQEARKAGTRLDILGASEVSGSKAEVESGSKISLEVSSEFADAYVAFVYRVGEDWYGFAVNVTDRSGRLSQGVAVPNELVSGSFEVRALVFDREGQAHDSNGITVRFTEGEYRGEPKSESRERYAPMSNDGTWTLADEKKAILKAQAQAQDGGRERIAPSAGDDTWTLADEKKAILKAQAQDDGRERVAPSAGSDTMTLADEKKAILKAQAQDDGRERVAPSAGSDTMTLDDEKKAILKAQAQAQDGEGRARVAPQGNSGGMSLADEKKAILKAKAQAQDGERKLPEPIVTSADVQDTKNPQHDPNGRTAPAAGGTSLSDEKKAIMKANQDNYNG